jgi:hypothetical protein
VPLLSKRAFTASCTGSTVMRLTASWNAALRARQCAIDASTRPTHSLSVSVIGSPRRR